MLFFFPLASGLIAAAEGAAAIRPERALLILVVAVAGAILPLTLAFRELRHPRDDAPLDIDGNYRKEDRFFATSFESRVEAALGKPPRPAGAHTVHFRDPEVIETISGNSEVKPNHDPTSILDVQGDLAVRGGAHLAKEALVGNNAVIESRASLRALKSGGDIRLGKGVHVERWVDAGGTLYAGSTSGLGARATSLTAIALEDGVTFRFLSAPLIRVGSLERSAVPAIRGETVAVAAHAGRRRHRMRADGALIVDEDFVVPAGTVSRGDVIGHGDVTIEHDALLIGSVHSDGTVIVHTNGRVSGSVIAERDITLEADAAIDEHAVAHRRAVLGRNARVGSPGRVTTLLADTSVELCEGATVYGRIVTFGAGRAIRA